MRYLINNNTDPHYNMAFDEWCLEHLDVKEPVFYLWRNRPSVIIGLNQDAEQEVNLPYLKEHGIMLARRVTGGGAVYHDLQNMNYSIIGHNVDTTPFVDALRSLGLDAEQTGRNDIFVDGKKISGYAKRVWKDRTIVHGTLMYDVDIDTLTKALSTPNSKLTRKGIASVRSRVTNLKNYLPQYPSLDLLQSKLHEIMAGNDDCIHLSQENLNEIQTLSDSKFSTEEWLYRPVAPNHVSEDGVTTSA